MFFFQFFLRSLFITKRKSLSQQKKKESHTVCPVNVMLLHAKENTETITNDKINSLRCRMYA